MSGKEWKQEITEKHRGCGARLYHRLLLALLIGVAASSAAPGQVAVLTQHNDLSRTGANLRETALTTANVSANQFGLLFSRPVDDEIYTQPLYVPRVAMPGHGVHNVVYVGTVNNGMYAFDADDPAAGSPLWHVNLGPAVPTTDLGTGGGSWCDVYQDFSHSVGITGTPVIDPETGTLYVVAKTREKNNYFLRLHALDLATGKEKFGGPVVIEAKVPGDGVGSLGGVLSFNPRTANQRPGLLLLDRILYIGFGAHCDAGPFHGWLLGYRADTLRQVTVYNTTPDGDAGGIWQSGQAPSADAGGDIYVMTGNGTFNLDAGGKSQAQSFLRLRPQPDGGLKLVDWFTPYNWRNFNKIDRDVGSTGPLLVPGTDLVLGAGKSGILYLLKRDAMGHFGSQAAGDRGVVEEFQAVNPIEGAPNGHLKGSPVYWNNPVGGPTIFLWGQNDRLRAYRIVNGELQYPAAAEGPETAPIGAPGAMLSLSANGGRPGTAILWASLPYGGDANQAVVPGVLRAFDAADPSHELWNSKQNAVRDSLGNFAKFSYPTIADGKVFLATFSRQLCVYGLLPSRIPAPPANLSIQVKGSKARLVWDVSPGANTYSVKRATAARGPFVPVDTGISDTSFLDTGLVPGTDYYYALSATNRFGESEDTPPVRAVAGAEPGTEATTAATPPPAAQPVGPNKRQ